MNEKDLKLLEDNGWIIICESPLEIEHSKSSSSYATGFAVYLIIEYYKHNDEIIKIAT